jgi:hypothetical protein
VVATYIGVALYVILYVGYTLWGRFYQKKQQHFVPLLEVDFKTGAVWKPGQGAAVRERDRLENEARSWEDQKTWGPIRTIWSKTKEHIY